jgi:hypothetical protein
MPVHHYRITVDELDAHPATGEGGLESLSFFASTPDDILSAAKSLRARLECSACHATRLAVGLSLINEVISAQRDPIQLHEPLLELFKSLEISIAAKANA